MTFPYQGRDIPYTLTRRRNMKTMRAKVMADGTIAVSAAPRVPTAEIVRFLTANAASLLEMQALAEKTELELKKAAEAELAGEAEEIPPLAASPVPAEPIEEITEIIPEEETGGEKQ